MVLWKNPWYYDKNYGKMEKNSDTIPRNMERGFTMKKQGRLPKSKKL